MGRTLPAALTASVAFLCLGLAVAAAVELPVLDSVRVWPAPGHAADLAGGRVIASNAGETVGFVTLATLPAGLPEGRWSTVEFANATAWRYVKYEGPDGSHGIVAELEFRAGGRVLRGRPFGVAGSSEGRQTPYANALDGETATVFDAFLADGAYVGLDLGTDANVAPTPQIEPAAGRLEPGATVRIGMPGGGARIRYTLDGSVPSPTNGLDYAGPIALPEGATVVTARASGPGRFPSGLASAAYAVGDVPPPSGLTTYSTGNSLSDTFNNEWLEAVTRSAGRDHRAYRFSVPGAPTDWLWTHPGHGFGRPDYARALVDLAPIDVLITQPFAGHGRSIPNEAEHSGNFYTLARESSPGVQLLLYQQWPGRQFRDRWARMEGDDLAPVAEARGLRPAAAWEEAVVNHTAYFEALRARMDADYPGPPVLIAPCGVALSNLKAELEAGRVPGLPRDRFFELHYGRDGNDIHMVPKGRYFVCLVLHCCLYREPPDAVSLPQEMTTLTTEQDAAYKRIAWETVRAYPWAGVAPLPDGR